MHSPILLGALGLPLVLASAITKRDCNAIEFTGKWGGDGYSTTYNTTFMVSQPMNCTKELAASKGSSKECEFERYAEGLITHSSINITVPDPQQIFEMIKETTGHMSVDFNETVVMNFTNPISSGYPVNFTGYYGFTPFVRCYEGRLTDCDGDEEAVNGTYITACGMLAYAMSNDPGRVAYDGEVGLVTWISDDMDKWANNPEPQPRYDDVKNNATVFGDENGAAGTMANGIWGGTMVAMAWALWWHVL